MRVAHKFALLIIVDGLAANSRQHNAEDDEHSQPDLPYEGGVIGDLVQQPRQEAPTHGGGGCVGLAEWVEEAEFWGWRVEEKQREKKKKKHLATCLSLLLIQTLTTGMRAHGELLVVLAS